MWFRTIFRRNPPAPPADPDPAEPVNLSLPPRLFPQLNRLRFRTLRELRGSGAGQRPSNRRKPAADFREHRKYVSGDDIRFVDWKASARSEQVFLKQGEQPQETTVHILPDTSGSMDWGDPPRRVAALQLAAALGYLALNGDDRLQVLPLIKAAGIGAERLRFKGKGQFPSLWQSLRRLPFGGRSDMTESFRRLAQTSRGGLVLVLSDLLDAADLAGALALLPRPAWQVVILHVLHPGEISPEAYGDIEMVDAETGRLVNLDVNQAALEAYAEHFNTWLAGIERECVLHNALYTMISTGWSLERETIPHLRRMGILEAS